MSSALMTPLRHTYSLRKRSHATPVSPVTEEDAASAGVEVCSDGDLSSPRDGIATDSDIASKGPRRGRPRRPSAGADLPRPGASAAAEARRRRVLCTSAARQFRKRPRHVSSPTPNDGDSPSPFQTMPAPSNNHASLLHALAEASVSCPDKTISSTVEEESENGKMKKEVGAGLVGEGQEVVVAERSDQELSFKMDSQVRDCNICYEPLKPPIFQCEVGHVLCSLCSEKLPQKCAVFCRRTCFSRCFALERIINAIRVPCSNTKYGCDEFITHDQKGKHESVCKHAPCFCPEDGCSFLGSRGSLLDHFVIQHGWLQTNLHYKKSLRISMNRDRRFTLLIGEDLSMFLLTNILTDIGHALTLACIRPHESGPSYSSKISAVRSGAVAGAVGRLMFQMDPLVASSSLLGGVQLGKFFLLVPLDLVDESTDELTINIRIDDLTSKSQQEAVA